MANIVFFWFPPPVENWFISLKLKRPICVLGSLLLSVRPVTLQSAVKDVRTPSHPIQRVDGVGWCFLKWGRFLSTSVDLHLVLKSHSSRLSKMWATGMALPLAGSGFSSLKWGSLLNCKSHITVGCPGCQQVDGMAVLNSSWCRFGSFVNLSAWAAKTPDPHHLKVKPFLCLYKRKT